VKLIIIEEPYNCETYHCRGNLLS